MCVVANSRIVFGPRLAGRTPEHNAGIGLPAGGPPFFQVRYQRLQESDASRFIRLGAGLQFVDYQLALDQ